MTAPTVDDRPRSGPPAWIAILAVGGLVLGVLLIAAQTLGIGVGPAGPAATVPPAGPAAQRTHDEVASLLKANSFQVQDPQTEYRPGESPELATVPRRVLQAVIPSDANTGYVVVYELPTTADADRVGRDFANYLASGTGAIQYPRDAQFVIRRVGQTLVFFEYSPLADPDPEVARLAATLATIGDPLTN